ncbi:hypothetical protein TNCV_4974441 [Trichonephila clavipes]|uniref:Uncharacterized protein n=1 Tax=Trichonephila clavipes TaxID=2585209 RepID=A0A8X6VGK8_TRICX|nr:hypothetical protein TNCV_4974441 [Trichonephila clavipes]
MRLSHKRFDHLEDNIRRVIADIRPQMLEKVIKNWMSRLDYIRASRGSPMPEIIFKIISSQSTRHCWRSPLPHASALIQRGFGCVLGVQQTKQLPHVAKVDLVWQKGGNLGRSLSNHGPQVFYRRKIWRASRPEAIQSDD